MNTNFSRNDRKLVNALVPAVRALALVITDNFSVLYQYSCWGAETPETWES